MTVYMVRDALELHLKDRLGLNLRELEEFHERFPGGIRALGLADGADNFLDVRLGYLETFQDMGAPLGLIKQEPGAPGNDHLTMLNKTVDHLLEREDARAV